MAVKTAGIASYLEDFGRHGSREAGLKMRCLKSEVIFAQALKLLILTMSLTFNRRKLIIDFTDVDALGISIPRSNMHTLKTVEG